MNIFQNTDIKILNGQRLQPIPCMSGTVTVPASSGNAWKFPPELMSRHMLALGCIGSGKTNLIYHIVQSVIRSITDDDIVIFFDSKGDFLRYFYRQGDYVIGNSRQYASYPLVKWNLFAEIASGSAQTREDIIQEISGSLFRKRIDTSKDPAFASGARDIFSALVESLYRDSQTVKDNQALKSYIRSLDIATLKNQLNRYSDLRWANIYMHNESSATTQSYLSPLTSVVNEVFSAHFAERGSFSIRKAIQERGGRSVFLEYDIVNSNLLDAVYTVLLDLAGKEALGNENEHRHVYFILDEFPLIPKLNYIDPLLNFGRSRGIRVIAGIQNVNQAKAVYGEAIGTSILSGFSTWMAFRLFDEESRHMFAERHGKNRRLIQMPYSDATAQGTQEAETGAVIEDWDVVCLQRGTCILSLPDRDPYYFSPALFQPVSGQIRRIPRIEIK